MSLTCPTIGYSALRDALQSSPENSVFPFQRRSGQWLICAYLDRGILTLGERPDAPFEFDHLTDLQAYAAKHLGRVVRSIHGEPAQSLPLASAPAEPPVSGAVPIIDSKDFEHAISCTDSINVTAQQLDCERWIIHAEIEGEAYVLGYPPHAQREFASLEMLRSYLQHRLPMLILVVQAKAVSPVRHDGTE